MFLRDVGIFQNYMALQSKRQESSFLGFPYEVAAVILLTKQLRVRGSESTLTGYGRFEIDAMVFDPGPLGYSTM
jgi:hypothetical protein